MSDGFLGRWSKRKLEVTEGKAVEPEPALPELPPTQSLPSEGASVAVEEIPPPPTLADANLLTPSCDFTRFAGRDVAPEVKNAAMKKLFADPRYNVMDGLDVYTGDYSQPDPMPASMLRQLVSAKFLNLFDDEEEDNKAPAGTRDAPDNPSPQSVAQSQPAPPAVPEHTEDADPDLRLQQDDAAPGEDPGRGAP